jgi:hypothetical protein
MVLAISDKRDCTRRSVVEGTAESPGKSLRASGTHFSEQSRARQALLQSEISHSTLTILRVLENALLRTGPLSDDPERARSLDFRRVDGGLLVQGRDVRGDDLAEPRVVTKRPPTAIELADLRFAWRVMQAREE